MATTEVTQSTTQKFLDIFDITNNLVILKDGTTSLILTVDAMNFGLLADEEQDSIMYAYASLLNSLNYPIQIIIRSQTKDVTNYLQLIKDQEDQTIDRTQQVRIRKYREFVSNLIRERNVLDKKFYVVIPAKAFELGIAAISSMIPGQSSVDINAIDKTIILEKARTLLEPKRDHLIAQFARIGLYSRQLETQEIIQYFYNSYNPESAEGQHIDESKSYAAPLVTAQTEINPRLAEQTQQFIPQPEQETTQQAPAQEVQPTPIQPELSTPATTPNPPIIQEQQVYQETPIQTQAETTSQPAQVVVQPEVQPSENQQQLPPIPQI